MAGRDLFAAPTQKGRDLFAEQSQWERATLLPMETNKATGERRLAMPQIGVDIGNALMAPGRAAQGEFGMEIDPATGRPTTVTNDLVKDTVGLAGLVGVGGTGAPLRQMIGSVPGKGAARRVVQRGMRDDQIDPANLKADLEAIGPDAVIADLGPRLQKQAQAVATMPGPGQKKVVSTLAKRQAGANQRIIGDVDATLGTAPIPSRVAAEIKANQDALGPEYLQAFRGARPVDTAPIAAHLLTQIQTLRGAGQKAAQKVRGMLDVSGKPGQLDPSPQTLFQTRQAIDGMLATEKDPKAVGVLSDARRMVDEMLGAAVPGIKEVDAKYAELARQSEALQTGQQALDSGRTAQRPSELVEGMIGGALPQGKGVGPSAVPFRLSQGTRAEIDRLIGTKANDLQALRQAVGGDGDWNRERLSAIFGPAKANKLLFIIARELRYQALERDALGGSRTQVLKAAQDEISGAEKKPGVIQNLLNLQMGTAAARAADKSLGWVGKKNRERVNAQIADLLMLGANDPASLGSLGNYVPSMLEEQAPAAFIRQLMLSGESPITLPAVGPLR